MLGKLLNELSPQWLRRPRRSRWVRAGAVRTPAPGEADALWRVQDEKGLYGSDTQDYAIEPEAGSATEKPADNSRGTAH